MTHPALQKAMDGCLRLAQAAGTVGSPDPIQAIHQIDYDPHAIEAYTQRLNDAATDLDKAIDEQKKAIAEHQDAAEGSASDSALAAMEEELAALSDERKQLDVVIGEVKKIATKMDELAVTASEQILSIAGKADPAVSMVLDGSWLDDVTGEGAKAEETVHLAVAEIIKLCQATQSEVGALRSELNAAVDAAESGAQGGSEGGVGAQGGGTSEGGAAGAGPADGAGAQGGQAEAGSGGTTD